MTKKRQMSREVHQALVQRQESENRQRERVNAGIARVLPGVRAKVGEKVLMKEAASTLHGDGLHLKPL